MVLKSDEQGPHMIMRLCLLWIMLFSGLLQASERVELKISPGVMAVADYWSGDVDKPPVMILHGFLQTRDFTTVNRLAEALAESQFPVLAPTLSLGISRRRNSLPCEAIHTHSMASDTAEIGRWLGWLYQRTQRKAVLIGHSVGSSKLLAYLSQNPQAPVEKVVLVSFVYFGEGRGGHETASDKARAIKYRQEGNEQLSAYGLSFCKEYVTTASNYLSYLEWDREALLVVAKKLSVPVTLIYGDADDRIDMAWLKALQEQGFSESLVVGANHFFDQAHEFDLLDRVEALLE